MHSRNDYFIKHKLYQYLLPGILMTVAMQLGNTVDSILVGNALDYNAVSAIQSTVPALFLMQSPAFLLGAGGASVAAVYLGKRDIKKASRTFSATLVFGILISLVFVISAPFLSSPIARILAVTDELTALAQPYIFVNMAGLPFLIMAIILSNYINVDNNPKLGCTMFIIANAVNLSLDYYFLYYTDLKMYGAALSTIIGYGVGLIIIIPYAMSKRRMLKFKLKNVFDFKLLAESSKTGLSAALVLVMKAINNLVLNIIVINVLGQSMFGIYSICINSVFFAELFAGGILGLIPTIAGVLYGEKDYFGIRVLAKKVAVISCIVISVLIGIFMAVPNLFTIMYGLDDPELLPTAEVCLRIFSICFLPYAFNKFMQNYYQTILNPFLASLNTILQGFIISVPVSLIMLNLFGVYGLCLSMFVSEVLTVLIVTIVRIIGQNKKKFPQKGILLIPDKDSGNYVDCTICGNEEDSVELSKKLIDFCVNNSIDKKTANIVGIAAEEITANILKYGYTDKSRNYIDVCLSKLDEKLILRIRDDGIPFNPTEYRQEDEGSGLMTGGINLVRSMSSAFKYMRTINLNNTIIEIKLSTN